MSYLLFANASRQRETDEKLDSKILKKIKAKNKAAELSKDIGKLFINDEIIPIKKIKYEKWMILSVVLTVNIVWLSQKIINMEI